MAQGGLTNLSSIFDTSQNESVGVNYIEDIHANGFTINHQNTDFLGIEGSTYTNPGGLTAGIDPSNQSVNASELILSPGFVPGLQEGDDTLFTGVIGVNFSNQGDLGFEGSLDTGPANYIANIHANGFFELGPIENGLPYFTQFIGIGPNNYTNPGTMGFGGDNDTGNANYIDNIHMNGFTSMRAPGTGELFNSVSEFIGAGKEQYKNPGLNIGLHYLEKYNTGPGVNFIKNKHMTGFTKNRGPGGSGDVSVGGSFQSLSEFVGIKKGKLLFENTGDAVGIHYDIEYDPNLGAIPQGVDFINANTYNSEGFEHASGFTKRIVDVLNEKNQLSEFHIVNQGKAYDPEINGTIFDELTPGSGEDFNFGQNYTIGGIEGNGEQINPLLSFNDFNINKDKRTRGVIIGPDDTQFAPLVELTLEQMYNNHIDKIIDFDTGLPVKAVGSSYDPANMGLYDFAGGFMPFTSARGNKSSEPYIRRGMGTRLSYIDTVFEDAMRLEKYRISDDGVRFQTTQNLFGLAAYFNKLTGNIGDEKNGGRRFLSDSGGGLGLGVGTQQFNYIYSPLSLFSSSVPYIKIRMRRDFPFNLVSGKYTERRQVPFLGNPSQNQKVRKDGGGLFSGDTSYFDDVNGKDWPSFNNRAGGGESEQLTTLGGNLINNVNESIDGSPISNEAIIGDHMTLAPIDTMDNKEVSNPAGPGKSGEASIHSSEKGYPFYFKDLRNDKILAFRGFIEDINENVNANWGETQFIGRSEPVYTYQNGTRDLNFTLKIFANNPRELDRIYEKLDYLTNLMYPQYFNDASLGYTRPKPPLTRLRLANLYGGAPGGNESPEYVNGALGFIQSLNYSFEGPWESIPGDGYTVPKFISANISYKIINDKVPGMDGEGNNRPLSPNYGYKYAGPEGY